MTERPLQIAHRLCFKWSRSAQRTRRQSGSQGRGANKRGVGTHPKKLGILKQLRNHFKVKHEKGVETPHYTPGGSCSKHLQLHVSLGVPDRKRRRGE